MISTLLGLWTGTLKVLITFSILFIDAIVVMLAFNYLVPLVVLQFGLILPFTQITLWYVWSGFILLYYIGKIIQMVIPTIININNSNTTN